MTVRTTVTKSVSIGGKSLSETSNIDTDGAIVQEVSVSPGETGTISDRTDDDTCDIDIDESGHTFTDGERVDVYWASGCRRGMTIGTVSGNTVPIDGGTGDALPVLSTAVTLVKPVQLDIGFVGTDAKSIALYAQTHGLFVFDNTGTEHLAVELEDGKVYIWTNGSGTDNPITGDTIVSVYVSHDGTAAATMRVGIGYDN